MREIPRRIFFVDLFLFTLFAACIQAQDATQYPKGIFKTPNITGLTIPTDSEYNVSWTTSFQSVSLYVKQPKLGL